MRWRGQDSLNSQPPASIRDLQCAAVQSVQTVDIVGIFSENAGSPLHRWALLRSDDRGDWQQLSGNGS
jgi:hypothetical protein